MNARNTRPRPIVLVVLDAGRLAAQRALRERYPTVQLALDDSDVITPESLAHNQVLHGLIRKTKDAGGRLHLLGLISDGGVSASWQHLCTLVDMAKSARLRVVVHAFLDGVDVPARSAAQYIKELEAKLDNGVGRIGTVSGRALAMDGGERWDRIEKVYKAISADGVDRVDTALRGLEEACQFGNTENFVKPFVVFDYPGVSLVDAALHFNFASDGARALSLALAGPGFSHFARKGGRGPFEGRFACMTPYHASWAVPTLFPRAPDPSCLGLEELAASGGKLFRCADGTAASIAQGAREALREARYDVVLADLGSPEQRSGEPDAAGPALEQAVEAARSAGARVLVLAGRDAANQSSLTYVDDGDPHTRLQDRGRLRDVAPTLFELLQRQAPADLDGRSLLIR